MSWGPEREALTAAYLAKHCGDCETLNQPAVIVLHGTRAPSIDALHASFDPQELPPDRKDLAWAGKVNLSTHYAIDREGGIVRFLTDERVGRHAVGLNHNSIGIEHLGDGPEHDLTAQQVSSSAALVRALVGQHDIEWLIGHHEAHRMACTNIYVERDEDYTTLALDPGIRFVDAVSAKVSDLGLKRPPCPEP